MLQRTTLLEIVQSVLSSLDSDAVNHIGETVESEQIALLAKEKFQELATYQNIKQFENLSQLEGLADPTKATVMRIPEGSTDIADIRYRHVKSDGTEYMREVHYQPKSDFLDTQLKLALAKNNTDINVLDDGIELPYRTDRGPTCWTTFDDEHVVFDSIDKGVDQTLHNEASLVIAYIVPEFRLEDEFIPPVPQKMLSQYMNMIKEVANFEQKQISNPFRTRDSERQRHRNNNFGGIYDGINQGESPRYQGKRSQGRRLRGAWRNGPSWS